MPRDHPPAPATSPGNEPARPTDSRRRKPVSVAHARGRPGRMRAALLTVAVCAGAGLLALGATRLLEARAADGPRIDPVAPLQVEVITVKGETGFDLERRFVGQVEADQAIALSFETGGSIATVSVDDGDPVLAGQRLASLDTRLLAAERQRLQASRQALETQRALARRTADRRESLRAQGFVSGQQADQDNASVAELTARLAEIDAALLGVQVRLQKSVLLAPFDGRVAVRHQDPGATAGAGQPVLSVVQTRAARLRVGLPPELAAALAPDARVAVEIGAGRGEGRFLALMPEINPATRARDALFALAADATGAPPGTTGAVVMVQRIAQPGAWVPVSALRNGVRGTWEVMTVTGPEGQETVDIEAVQIVHADAARAYVNGTFEAPVRIVADGVHRVVRGQRVRVTPAELARGGPAAGDRI